MGVPVRSATVRSVLEVALDFAAANGQTLATKPELDSWRAHIRYFQQPHVPMTYLPVATTMVVAKAVLGASVDVNLLQSGAGAKGYSAATVASILQGFAKSNGIDLRSTSQSPFNNQPFTFKVSLDDVEPGTRGRDPFSRLRAAAKEIEAMTSADALRALSATFVLTERIWLPARTVDLTTGRDAFRAVCRDVATFVTKNSDGGRVGQALAAALLDLQHHTVVLGAVNDPDARMAGDVHALHAGEVWLWCEVKQKTVVTGDVLSFMRKVAAAGGQRCLYLAMDNHRDPTAIDGPQARSEAELLGIDLVLIQSPHEAIAALTQFAAGEQSAVAARLLERLRARLVESNGQALVLRLLDDLIDQHIRPQP